MAKRFKSIKKQRVTGSRVTPRKDAKKIIRNLMVNSFEANDQYLELNQRFEAGKAEIMGRDDVPQHVKDLFTKFSESAESLTGFLQSQDKLGTQAMDLLNNHTLPYTDIEADLAIISMEMSNAIDQVASKQAARLADASELAMELDDVERAEDQKKRRKENEDRRAAAQVKYEAEQAAKKEQEEGITITGEPMQADHEGELC